MAKKIIMPKKENGQKELIEKIEDDSELMELLVRYFRMPDKKRIYCKSCLKSGVDFAELDYVQV